MRDIFKIAVRPYEERDKKPLELWRAEFNGPDRVLELPNGYERDHGLITNVAVSGDGRKLGSLTGTTIVALDPFIRNPHASSVELLQSLFALCRSVEVDAARSGALESYIAIPNDLSDYQHLVEKCGFRETAQNCRIFRHPFFPVENEE